jgi:hypothetical protein
MANHQPQSAGNGPPSAGMMQHGPGGQVPPAPAQNMSQQNLNQIVRAPDLPCAMSCYLLAFRFLRGCVITLPCQRPFECKHLPVLSSASRGLCCAVQGELVSLTRKAHRVARCSLPSITTAMNFSATVVRLMMSLAQHTIRNCTTNINHVQT